MPSESRSPRLAVLIDADNTSSKIANGLFEEIAKLGEASVRRIYGDFSGTRSKGWTDILAKHAIIPQQQFAYTTGKNASDITLVIDAMDLLHSGRFDGFCLVSSDSDFTRLAARIRETPNWRVLAPVPLQTICVRHEPGLTGDALDAHTQAWADRVNRSGQAYLTPATLDGRWMVRISIGALLTEREHLETLWNVMQAEAERG